MARKINKTYSAKLADIQRKWYLIDADGLVLGRLAVIIADYLRGKNKSLYTPTMDCGDYIVVTNVDKIALTGNKLNNKNYYWHTGYPGGLKTRTAKEILEGKHPEHLLYQAVKRMLSNVPLARRELRKLFIYTGPEHQHTAQKPEVLDIAALNIKNKRIS